MVSEHYIDRWAPRIEPLPNTFPTTTPSWPPQWTQVDPKKLDELREEIAKGLDKLKPTVVPAITPEEILEFRKLLDRAREYDKRNNEPECELDSKVALLKAIAKALGVDLPLE